MFLWRNSPSIVIGRNQIPWLECDVLECERQGIPIIRRYSGGGAVYHDEGNALYSVIVPKTEFSRSKYISLMAEEFTRLGIQLETNARHDILHNGHKVSGSAFRLIRDRAYHHGTMLMRTDLERLKRLLKSPLDVSGPAVSSVISKVTNVCQLTPDLFNANMLSMFKKSIGNSTVLDEQPIFVSETSHMAYVKEDMHEISQWEWTFGRGPKFKVALSPDMDLHVEQGIITDCTAGDYVGQRFDTNLLKLYKN